MRESHGNAWIIHTDLGVFVATLLLAGFTFVHVRHFRRLVERIERIYELQSTPRIVASLIDDEGHAPRIRVQNIGQVPLVVVGLRFQLLQFGSMIEDPPSQDVSEIRYSWMVPGETRMIDRPLLRRLWTDGSARSVTIECSYLVPQFCDPWSKVGRTSQASDPALHSARRIPECRLSLLLEFSLSHCRGRNFQAFTRFPKRMAKRIRLPPNESARATREFSGRSKTTVRPLVHDSCCHLL